MSKFHHLRFLMFLLSFSHETSRKTTRNVGGELCNLSNFSNLQSVAFNVAGGHLGYHGSVFLRFPVCYGIGYGFTSRF